MKKRKKMQVVGLLLLFVGLISSLCSQHYENKTMGDAALGVAVLAPSEGTDAWEQKVRLRLLTQITFFVGLGLTALGILIQLLAIVINPKLTDKGSVQMH